MNHRPHPPHLLSVIFLVMVVFLKALLLEVAVQVVVQARVPTMLAVASAAEQVAAPEVVLTRSQC